jgi:flagellar motor switch/type III secretory pathway protein FliN
MSRTANGQTHPDHEPMPRQSDLMVKPWLPIHMLLRMGRGAVIELDSTDSDMVEILANNHPIGQP